MYIVTHKECDCKTWNSSNMTIRSLNWVHWLGWGLLIGYLMIWQKNRKKVRKVFFEVSTLVGTVYMRISLSGYSVHAYLA